MDTELTQFDSGAVRSGDLKNARYDLISPIGVRRIAETCHEGAVKYTPFNWEKGMPVHDLLNHAMAHVFKYLSGDRSEDHLAHAGWNLLGAMHSEELWPHLNAGQQRGPGCVAPEATPPLQAAISTISEAANEAVRNAHEENKVRVMDLAKELPNQPLNNESFSRLVDYGRSDLTPPLPVSEVVLIFQEEQRRRGEPITEHPEYLPLFAAKPTPVPVANNPTAN